ncbi:mechanosensitive ion channel domain-containing protein [Malikia sp.]|uniref:mechanosensitive ion channel family protein n=1 Tax=Malikia sp. TaxID=2070706 RepID=UPI00261EBF98|nr:mechanosensitive ion channel domain-containing protein [Malikia sp.]MDD2729905.1 mechanosensitive ion channel [Malikia sp.]
MTATPTPIPINDFSLWLTSFGQPEALLELAILATCGLLAWGLVALLRRVFSPDESHSIWFGSGLVDGVLFPTLLLGLGFAARTLWSASHPVHLLRIAIPVLLALVVIRVGVKVLQVAFRQAAWLRPIERTISWVAWLTMVLWVSGLLPVLLNELDQISWKIGGSKLSVRTLIEGALTACAVLLVTLWISSAIESRLLRAATGSELSLRKAASNATRALLMFVGLIAALTSVGIDLSALSVLGGAIGVGIGFGLQKLAANYVSGFVILTERSMRIGDMVRVDNFEGRITDIKARFTVIRSIAGREAIVPNEILITSRVENLSLADPRVSQSTLVNVAYESDVDRVASLLTEAARAQPRVLADPAPMAALSAFGADGLEFTLSYWIADPEVGTLGLKSDINRAILTTFRAQGIDIPYPQRVLHVTGNQPTVATPGRPPGVV